MSASSSYSSLLAAPIALLALVAAHAASAQSDAELQRLAFHPVPLQVSGTPLQTLSCSGDAGLRCADGAEAVDMVDTVDMAMFEELSVERYLADIALLEEKHGPYAAALTEQLLAVGLLYQQQERHDEALASLERAAAVSRISQGLHTVEQIALVEHSLVSLKALQRHDEVDAAHRRLLDLHRRVHGEQSLQTAEAMLRSGQWQVARLQQELAERGVDRTLRVDAAANPVAALQQPADPFAPLYAAQTLFSDAIRIHVEQQAWSAPALFQLERELIHTFYMDAQREQLLAPAAGAARSSASARARLHRRANTLAAVRQYRDGELAYRRMIGYLKQDPAATAEQITAVLSGLADWHLLFGEVAEAGTQYEQVARFLALLQVDAGDARAILDPPLPQPLPAFLDSPLKAGTAVADATQSGHVDVAFSIGRSGSVTGLDVLGASANASDAVVDRLLALLRSTRFRPGSNAPSTAAVRYHFSY